MTRRQIYDAYQGKKTKTLERYFLKYDRYREAKMIHEFIGSEKYNILDYGCGVGDYGMYFLRKGYRVEFYDIDDTMMHFVNYRLQRESLIPGSDKPRYDLIIFGEVLEHMDEPQKVLQQCIDVKVPILVTTAYPYIQDPKEFERHQEGKYHSHSIKARDAQPKCRELLENNYNYYKREGEFRIWHNLHEKTTCG